MSIVIDSPQTPMPQCWKRKEHDDEDELEVACKKAKYSWYVTLESESPIPTDEDTESIYTIQGNETEFARDTSDTSGSESDNWDASSDTVDMALVEYEIASDDNNDVNDDMNISSSEPEDYVTVGVIAAFCDSDVGLADGSDDSRSSVDSEISRADYWTCIQCNNSNNNPLFRYCEKCYQIRKSLFPRPRRMKKKQRVRNVEKPGPNIKSEGSSQEFTAMDSGLGSSQERTDDLKSASSSVSSGANSPTEFFKLGAIANEDVVDGPKIEANLQAKEEPSESKPKIESKGNSEDNSCLICTVNSKDGVFVHGDISHISCCYKCAVKVWKSNNKHCPICNRKVTQVLKAYFV